MFKFALNLLVQYQLDAWRHGNNRQYRIHPIKSVLLTWLLNALFVFNQAYFLRKTSKFTKFYVLMGDLLVDIQRWLHLHLNLCLKQV
jgi:hypothetical protein